MSSKQRKVDIHNEAAIPNNMLNLQGKGISNYNMNMYIPQEIKLSSIPYRDKQPAKLNSWNREALLISLFRTNK